MILTKPSPIELTGHDCHPDHLDPDELVAEHTPRHQTDEPHATCEPALTILMNRICEAHSNRTDHAVDTEIGRSQGFAETTSTQPMPLSWIGQKWMPRAI